MSFKSSHHTDKVLLASHSVKFIHPQDSLSHTHTHHTNTHIHTQRESGAGGGRDVYQGSVFGGNKKVVCPLLGAFYPWIGGYF